MYSRTYRLISCLGRGISVKPGRPTTICPKHPFTAPRTRTVFNMTSAVQKFTVDGTIAAPATALLPNGDVHTDAIKTYVDFLASHDIDGVFILGTLGEGMSLTLDERKAVAQEWVKQSENKLEHVMVQVGAGNLRDSIELARHADSIKASAIACLSPTYFKPANEELMVEYLAQVAAAAPNTPFFYYCINFMTGVYLNTAKVLELSSKSIPTLRGIKMSSRELPDLLDCTQVCDGRLNIMVGTDEQFLTSLSLKVRVPVCNGFLGPLFKRLREAFDNGDMETARKEQLLARDIKHIQAKYGGGPPVVKAIMKCLGLDLGPVRLPLKDVPDSRIADLKKDLVGCGLID